MTMRKEGLPEGNCETASWRRPRSSARDDLDELDPVAVLERAGRPFVAHQRLLVEFDQDPSRIKAATDRQFTQCHRRADLPRVPVDENAEALLERFGHGG